MATLVWSLDTSEVTAKTDPFDPADVSRDLQQIRDYVAAMDADFEDAYDAVEDYDPAPSWYDEFMWDPEEGEEP